MFLSANQAFPVRRLDFLSNRPIGTCIPDFVTRWLITRSFEAFFRKLGFGFSPLLFFSFKFFLFDAEFIVVFAHRVAWRFESPFRSFDARFSRAGGFGRADLFPVDRDRGRDLGVKAQIGPSLNAIMVGVSYPDAAFAVCGNACGAPRLNCPTPEPSSPN